MVAHNPSWPADSQGKGHLGRSSEVPCKSECDSLYSRRRQAESKVLSDSHPRGSLAPQGTSAQASNHLRNRRRQPPRN